VDRCHLADLPPLADRCDPAHQSHLADLERQLPP
jgi:hypothetical protein